MLAQAQLLNFWNALLHLRSSDELGDKLGDFAGGAFENLDSIQLYALEETPGNPRSLRPCGGADSGEKVLLSKHARYAEVIGTKQMQVFMPAPPDWQGEASCRSTPRRLRTT